MATLSVANPEAAFRNLLPAQGGDIPPGAAEKFYVEDGDAIILGRYAEGGEPAIAIKRLPTWTSVFVGRPGGLGPDLLHAIARDAGAFTLLDAPGNLAATDGNVLVLHGVAGGRVTVRLPFKAAVEDLVGGQPVAPAATALELDLPVQESRILGLRRR
jgi:hypothetical protein